MEKKWSIRTGKHGTNSGISVFSTMEILTTTTRLTTRFSSLNNVHTIGNMTLITQFRGFNQLNVVKDFSSAFALMQSTVCMKCISIEGTTPVSFVFRAYASTKLSNLSSHIIFFSSIVSCFIFPSLENVLKCINFRCYAKFKFTGEINIMVGIRRCLTCI